MTLIRTTAPIAIAIALTGCPDPEPTEDGSSSESSGEPSTTMSTTVAPTTSATATTESPETTAESSTTDPTTESSEGESSSSGADSSSGSSSESTGGVAPYEILDPMAEHFGGTYQDWAGGWWQWAYSLPFTNHPLFDDVGTYCTAGQSGEVFYLGGTFNGAPAMRTCTSPADTAIFLPIVNTSWDNAGLEMQDWMTDMELQDGASGFIDAMDDFSIAIDGDTYDMAALADYRVGIYQSSYEVPDEDSLYDYFGYPVPVVGTVDPTFGDGVYVMIEFQSGDHEIQIYAHDDGLDPMDTGDDFTVDVTYTLTVE